MSSAVQIHARREYASCANGDGACVDEGGVEVHEDACTEYYVFSVVGMKGLLHPGLIGEELVICLFCCCFWGEQSLIADDAVAE